MELVKINEEIMYCNKCTRLREWCQSQQGTKERYAGEKYWERPVPGYGDPDARILIVGLAPAAHGANRTGRVFTGDSSGNYLFETMKRHGFSNKGESRTIEDLLHLSDAYITNFVKCAPPQNKPTSEEFAACRVFLENELANLPNLKVILALGGQAFDQVKRILKKSGANVSGIKFGHGVMYDLGNNFPILMGSYHPSRYNIDTKRLTPDMLDEVFVEVKKHLELDNRIIFR